MYVLADVIQLLMVALQYRMFRREASGTLTSGGSNKDIINEVEELQDIPVEDFTIKAK